MRRQGDSFSKVFNKCLMSVNTKDHNLIKDVFLSYSHQPLFDMDRELL